MNRERLQMVRDRIASEPPERLDMSAYHCGSAHCIAGWADVIMGTKPTPGVDYRWDAGHRAQAWLGLDTEQANELFQPVGFYEIDYTQADALAALDSLINADSDDALPVWPERVSA